MDKRVANADVAIEKLFDGATILAGGFAPAIQGPLVLCSDQHLHPQP